MNLYRRSTFQASMVLLLASVVAFTTVAAQRRKPHKLRATALVEFVREPSGATTQRLIPITILDDGAFHDASDYKSTPEPMALDSGVVYEAQKTGQIMGYFTVGKAIKVADLWTGQGRWQPPAPPKPPSTVSAGGSSAKSADDRPILHHGGSSPSPSATTSPTPEASSTPAPSSSSSPSDDRPVLHRSSNDNAPSSTPTPTSTPAAAPSPSPTVAASAPEPEPDDSDRPTLRHRAPGSAKPVEVLPESTPTPVGATAAATPKPAPASHPAPAVAVQQTLVAVSDAQSSESRSYDFIWKAGEFEAQEGKMRRLALAELARESGGPQLTEKALNNVVIRGFDLDLSNEPVLVLSAEIPPTAGAPAAKKPLAKAGTKGAAGAGTKPPAATTSASGPSAHATRYITLIARVDADGEPQKLAASVTDSTRLDVAPRLELIDAVDVDGDGFAELLFRQYSFDDKSFVIFSIGRTTVSKLFEGASQPLN